MDCASAFCRVPTRLGRKICTMAGAVINIDSGIPQPLRPLTPMPEALARYADLGPRRPGIVPHRRAGKCFMDGAHPVGALARESDQTWCWTVCSAICLPRRVILGGHESSSRTW